MPSYTPTVEDLLNARSILTRKLPVELVLQILDHAHYWFEKYHQMSDYVAVLDEDFSEGFSGTKLLLAHSLTDIFSWHHRPKLREIEFTFVSHDQGWTTEDTKGTYTTSSWFEVSIVRRDIFEADWHQEPRSVDLDIYAALERIDPTHELYFIERPRAATEPQRQHCEEMRRVDPPKGDHPYAHITEEGKHAWWIQGNEVARAKSVYEGEFIKRYTVIWGNTPSHRSEGNEGSGHGEGFLESIQEGDFILLWARAKRRGWENHVHGARVTLRFTI